MVWGASALQPPGFLRACIQSLLFPIGSQCYPHTVLSIPVFSSLLLLMFHGEYLHLCLRSVHTF